MSNLRFALVGNQNCGKSTLFNQLTGSNQHVGNFPGVTVQMQEGILLKHSDISLIDLPGVYSLSPYSSEEIVTRDLLLCQKPDLIINVVDVTSIERSLYLTMQCIELDIPMVIALNMMDELRASHGNVNIRAMEKELSVPVIPISAQNGDGIDELLERSIQVAKNHQCPKRLDFCPATSPAHVAIHAVVHLIEKKAKDKNLPPRFCATKLIEDGEMFGEKLDLNTNEKDIIGHFVQEMETSLSTDKEAALADMRYAYIDYLCNRTVHKPSHTEAQLRSIKIDQILTHKYFGLPIFMGLMGLVFYLTFDIIGGTLSDYFEEFLSHMAQLFSNLLLSWGVSQGLHSFLIDGVCGGIISVLSFLPTILTLFLLLSMLQDSGYMARVAFVMDKLLRKIGLSGASIVPMLIGFGCTVPAIMATRTLPSERDRKMTILITPFMSCSAKLPVYAMFCAALFPKNGALVMFFLYMMGILIAVLTSLLMRHSVFQGKPVPFVMELPTYRIPGFKSVWLQICLKAKNFLRRAFTVIFLASMIIWYLQNFNLHFYMVTDPSTSIIADLGKLAAPFFAPLGFGNWQASAALITGLTAKEVVISTLSVLTGAGDGAPDLTKVFTTASSAYAYLTFILLYPPCVASMAVIRRELNSTWQLLTITIYQITVAWVMAFIVYHIF